MQPAKMTRLMSATDEEAGSRARRAVVARPDRAEKAAMTTRAPPRLRKIFKVLAAELDTTMDRMQVVALYSFIENFKVRSEWRAAWERLSKFAPCDENGEADAD